MTADIRRLSERKRHGEELAAGELRELVAAYTAGEIDDAPMAAWLMAVCCAGMTEAEAWALTEAMTDSGERLDLAGLSRPTVDKHSTGGVGDKVTLVAGPIAAACGACVAKMSGRGLGHTGGTIDKLEAIPGLSTQVTSGDFMAQAERVGLVVAAQSIDLAPADGKMYALRDATGTVDSPALIAASIMSKKLAAGADAIVLDVTVGSGAFMRERGEALALAELMVGIGRRAGRCVGALITDMDQPLGEAVGNAIEVEEAVRALRGFGPPDVHEVSATVAAWMLVAAGIAGDEASGRTLAEAAISSGTALDVLREMVQAQGGDPSALDRPLLGHVPAELGRWGATEAGWITHLDARGVGYAALAAGAGRRRKTDEVDPAAGVRLLRKVCDRVEPGDILAEVTARSHEHLIAAFEELDRAYQVGDEPPEPGPLVLDIITPSAEVAP